MSSDEKRNDGLPVSWISTPFPVPINAESLVVPLVSGEGARKHGAEFCQEEEGWWRGEAEDESCCRGERKGVRVCRRECSDR